MANFSQVWHGETSWNFSVSNVKKNIFQIKIFEENTISLLIIYSSIKFKVLWSLPKSFHRPLTVRMHCNWTTDHPSDHTSIGLGWQYSKCSIRFNCLYFVSEQMALTSGSQRTTLNMVNGTKYVGHNVSINSLLFVQANYLQTVSTYCFLVFFVGGEGGTSTSGWFALFPLILKTIQISSHVCILCDPSQHHWIKRIRPSQQSVSVAAVNTVIPRFHDL